MKTKDIAKEYNFDVEEFERWLQNSAYKYKMGFFGGFDVDDSQDIVEVVNAYNQELNRKAEEQERIARENAEREHANLQKQTALASMLITSGFNFDGYTITKYSGYISGDDAVQINRGTDGIFARATDTGSALMTSLVKIRRNALAEVKEAAYALGCNAVIGIDFDYLTLSPETANSGGGTTYLPYVFGVTANGNAVVIEKNS